MYILKKLFHVIKMEAIIFLCVYQRGSNAMVIKLETTILPGSEHVKEIVSAYNQDIPQSQTTDKNSK